MYVVGVTQGNEREKERTAVLIWNREDNGELNDMMNNSDIFVFMSAYICVCVFVYVYCSRSA